MTNATQTTEAAPDLAVRIAVFDAGVEVDIRDARPDTTALFERLSADARVAFATDAWSIGVRALGNARAQARESELAEIGERMVSDLDQTLGRQLAVHQQAMTACLMRFFDPSDGAVTRRLADFVADEGGLAQQLRKQIGHHQSALVDTLGQLVGQASPLLRRLSPEGDESVVKAIDDRLTQAVAAGQRELVRALDPGAEDGPIRRFMLALREELSAADHDREKQLAAAVAALDANDESSLVSRLLRETRQAQDAVRSAINPDSPDSPLGAIRRSIEELIHRSATRQEQFAGEVREALARLETRRSAASRAPIGGVEFEAAVSDFVVSALGEGPYVAEPTGATVGSVPRSKKGDVVVRFTAESAFDGAAVVVEAKRDASFNVSRALDELEQARRNRDASVGLFVMAASHAPAGFPRFARHGSNVLVQWDEDDPGTDAYLRGAMYLALGLVRCIRPTASPEEIAAVANLGARIEEEIKRLDGMQKHSDNVRRAVDGLDQDLRKARNAMTRLLADAQVTIRALHLDAVDVAREAEAPISFSMPDGSTLPLVNPLPDGQ